MDEILKLIESVSKGFPSYSWNFKIDREQYRDFPNSKFDDNKVKYH